MATTVNGTDNLFLNVSKYMRISKQNKARELDMITLRNHAPRSHMT